MARSIEHSIEIDSQKSRIQFTMMGVTLSTQKNDKQRNRGCFERIPPLLPKIGSNFCIEHPNPASTTESAYAVSSDEPASDVLVSPDNADTLPSTLKMSWSAKELESISSKPKKRGPNDKFILMSPREALDRNPDARSHLLDSSRRWEPLTARPKPIYPCKFVEHGEAPPKRHKPDCSPAGPSLDDGSNTQNQEKIMPNQPTESPNAFQIQSNLFIPIRDSDNDSGSEVESRPPPKQLEGQRSSVPRLKLRPRGKQIDLSLERYGLS
eukprot:scaffold405_cov132-Cylindrotheca_fusiformis.AAC.18